MEAAVSTREETTKALQMHGERLEAAWEAIAHHIGGTRHDVAEYIVKTQKETGRHVTKAVNTAGTSIAGAVKEHQQHLDVLDKNVKVAIDEARKHADLTRKVYDAFKKKKGK